MAANKFASAYLNGAYQRMLAAVQKCEPVAFDLEPTSEQFQLAADELRNLAVGIDDFVHALAREASSNALTHISTNDRLSVFTDALHDCGLLGELEAEADDLRQETEAA